MYVCMYVMVCVCVCVCVCVHRHIHAYDLVVCEIDWICEFACMYVLVCVCVCVCIVRVDYAVVCTYYCMSDLDHRQLLQVWCKRGVINHVSIMQMVCTYYCMQILTTVNCCRCGASAE